MASSETSLEDPGHREQRSLLHLGDAEVECVFELGRKTIGLREAGALEAGSVIVLDKKAGERIELRVNGTTLAYGEIVVIRDRMMAHITGMIDRPDTPGLVARAAAERESAGQYPPPQPVTSETDLRRHMILIPGGQFTMGADADSPADQRPARLVRLTAFYIAPYPVTNQDYVEFANATGHPTLAHWREGTYPPGKSKHPVVNVSWHDATASYAQWLGARLRTEAEWEKAARSSDQRQYPWGNRFVEGERCNSNGMVGDTLNVDEFSLGRSPYGVWDMAGNAHE